MKNLLFILFFLSLTSCFFNESSESDPITYGYEPVVLTRTVFENAVAIEDNLPLVESSKIYVIGNYIFINDKRKGFHIFDNTNPETPIKKKFLNIPGATDIAIRGNILYVNQATDLVVLTFDFSTCSIEVKNRLKDVFPVIISPEGQTYYEEGKVVVNWIEK